MSWWDRWKRGTNQQATRPEEPQGGLDFHLTDIEFSDGTRISLRHDSILVLTGANNVGKSSTLTEIFDYMVEGQKLGPLLRSISVHAAGSTSAFIEHANLRSLPVDSLGYVTIDGRNYRVSEFEDDIKKKFVGSRAAGTFLAHLTAVKRLEAADPSTRESRPEQSRKPIQWLEFDEAAEQNISSLFERIFGVKLVLNRLAGDRLKLHLSKNDQHARTTGISRETVARLARLPQLERQGDGMRSFAGLMLSLLVNTKKVVLIDEPEAFLHPPQIRKLADVLARNTPEQTQIIVATHSDEFIRGLLDASGNRVSVARIDRKKDDTTVVSVLDSEQITNLWIDPLLRTSDVLSSLFHEAAIICEGETDARFFRTLLDAITTEQRRPDVRFYHFGGKDKVASIASALKLVSVPVVAVVDIDVLSDKTKFLSLFSIMGGNPDEVEKEVTLLVAKVQSKKSDLSTTEIALELEKIAAEVRKSSSFADQSRKQIADIGKSPSPWQRIKEDGYRGFADSALINAFQKISAASEAVGLLILKEGELEGFCRGFSRKNKAEWLASVLQLNLEEDERLLDARSFAVSLLNVVAQVIDDLAQTKSQHS
jgi:hypothetical protein